MSKNQNKHLPLSKIEIEALKEAKDDLLDIYFETGVRRTEIFELFRENNWVNPNLVQITGKGDKKRLIPVMDSTRDKIMQAKRRFAAVGTKTINNHFVRMGIVLGIKNFNPHRLRATFATTLIENGVDLVTIQTLMGHSSISTTSGYIKINLNMLTSAIQIITNNNYHLDGMTIEEMKKEILNLRRRLNRKMEDNESN